MISYVRGELAAISEEKAVVEAGGIGYGIFMPVKSIGMLPDIGEEIKIYTYLSVREDAMQLFGFLTKDDLEVFKLLIGVSGIGPKGGLGILGALTADELRFAVLSGDVKAITAAPGIGKKTAERLIIELKDRLKLEDMLGKEDDSPVDRNDLSGDAHAEAVQALVALGYGSTESLRVVRSVKLEGASTEAILKEALKKMM
ncbi:MAG: Holliday junction branch migration protein RuvA [Hespellia sp.]|nr:Holliday junction branch migration protein RuvA [Hespellia sp.]